MNQTTMDMPNNTQNFFVDDYVLVDLNTRNVEKIKSKRKLGAPIYTHPAIVIQVLHYISPMRPRCQCYPHHLMPKTHTPLRVQVLL